MIEKRFSRLNTHVRGTIGHRIHRSFEQIVDRISGARFLEANAVLERGGPYNSQCPGGAFRADLGFYERETQCVAARARDGLYHS